MDNQVSLPVPQPVAFFGFRTGIKGNVHFISEHEILYSAGCVLVIHHLLLNTQKFMKPADQQKSIKEIVLSPNRKVVAITSIGDKMNITLYDVGAMKRKKVLVLPEATEATEFVTFTFTHDSKGILAVTGEPEWMLYYFNWEKGKLESSCKATVPGNPGTVAQVVAHPNDNTSCILVGPGLFRMMAVAETVWRQFGWQKADQLNICCAAHLAPERIVAATKDGRFVIVENNDLKGIVKAWDLKELDPKALEMQTSTSVLSISDSNTSADREIRCLIPFLRGFLFAQGPGAIFLFEADTNMVYRRKSVLVVPPMDIEDMFDHVLTTIRWVTVNPSMERMVVATDRSQLYTSLLWKTDTNEEGKVNLEILGPPLHHGPIAGLALCQWKPIFMTVGKVDRTVRLWNYETETQDFAKQYLEDIYCIALHPTGFYVALGFCDKLRYMTVSIDDLVQTREFPIRNCTVCSFSTHGHLFAAANGNIIQIFSTLSYQNMYNLRGHFGRITKMAWTPFDLKLVSCGLEGAVYEWDIATSARINEVITKACGYTDVVVTADGRTSFAVGTDGLVKELNESEILRQIPIGDGHKLDAIAFSRSNLMLFVAGMEGVLFSVKFPLSEPIIYNDYMMHSGDITGMALTWDDRMIISISEDGSVCLWKLTRTEGKAISTDKEFTHCKEILINRKDLADKINAIKELSTRLTELKTEHAYQIKQMEARYQEEIAHKQANYRNVVDELKETNEAIEAEHSTEINKMATAAAELKHRHEQEMQQLEASYFQKLIVEYNKYTNLDQRLIRTREDYEKQLEALQESKEKALQSQEETYLQQLRDKNSEYEELLRLYEKEREDGERMRLQIEDDADREIVTLRVSFESSLREERDNNVRLRSEVGILKKKLIGSQREVDELRLEITQLQNEQRQFQKAVHTLERDSSDLKKEVQERDSILQQKERAIAELKRQTQELDKYRFVLHYKINELKSQIEPKDLEIKEKKEQIQDMEQEIEKLQNAKDAIQLHQEEFREKYLASEAELVAERKKHQNTHRALRRIWIDFHGTSSLIQRPKELKEALKVLYQKYSGNPSLFLSKVQDTEAQCEFMRQREHLERTVASLKRQVYKGSIFQQGEHDKIVEHNIALMKELKSVRGQLIKCQHAQSILDKIMAPPGTRTGDHKLLQQRLAKILQEEEDVGTHGARRVRDLQKLVEALTEEVQRLSTLLAQAEDADKSQRSHQTTQIS